MSETPNGIEPPISPPEDAAAVARIRRWNRFYKIAVIWLIGWAGLIVKNIVDLDDVVHGLQNGLMRCAATALLLLLVTLPLGLLGSKIGSWGKWRRYRLWFTFALPTLLVLMGVMGSLKGRYFPQDRFRRMTGVEFPREARVERVVYDDGIGAVEWSCTYEFSCSPEETGRLLREMKLENSTLPPSKFAVPTPKSKGWVMTEVWQGSGASREIYILLQTDASHTKLCMLCYPTF